MPFKFPPAGAVFQQCSNSVRAVLEMAKQHMLHGIYTGCGAWIDTDRESVCVCVAASIYDFKVNNFPMKYGAYYPTVAASKDHSFGLF